MSSIKNNYLHIYFYTQTILPLQISDEELSRAEQQEAIETLKPIQKSTINMFGHLNLLAALFFIGTLKGELNQLQLNGDFSVHSEKISQKIVNIKAHFIIFNMKSALNKTLKLGIIFWSPIKYVTVEVPNIFPRLCSYSQKLSNSMTKC